jgi:CRP/FNR family transcriptional regulator, cyclic AMP receptor protein
MLTGTKDLKGVRLFAGLADKDREFLARNLDEFGAPAGEKLITEGQGNYTFFVVREGQVEIRVGGEVKRVLGAGDFFGEISVDQHVPATATVVAKTPVRLWVMSLTQFRAVKANEPLLLALRTAMVERLLQNRP